MWQILQPITPNVTPINAPYRVRVIEMVIEVTFEQTVNLLYSIYFHNAASLKSALLSVTIFFSQWVFAPQYLD